MSSSTTPTVRRLRRSVGRTLAAVVACGLVVAGSAPPARADGVIEWNVARDECLKRKPTGGPYGKTFSLKQCCLIALSGLEPNVDDIRCWAERPRNLVPRVPPLPPVPGVRRRPTTTVPTTAPTTAPTTSPGVSTPTGSPGIAVGGGQPAVPAVGQIDSSCVSDADRPQIEQLIQDRTAREKALLPVVRTTGRTKPAALAVRLQALVDLDELTQQLTELKDALRRNRSTVCAPLQAPPAGSGEAPAPPPATLPKDPATGRDVLPTTEVTIEWSVTLRSLPFKYSTRYTFRCGPLTDPSKISGVVGTDQYTGDSSICGAGVHAGKIGFGGGVVTVVGEQASAGTGGPTSYKGSTRNGIRSGDLPFESPTVMTFV